MKTAITLLILMSFNAQAMNLFCTKAETPKECALKAEAALERIGCQLNKQDTDCTYSLIEDPKNPGSTIQSKNSFCKITSTNCRQPRVGNFGGETCIEGAKVQIEKIHGVNNGYWFGLFGSYSRTICVVR